MSRILCLLYHRIKPYTDDLYNITVSPHNFENHLKYLKEHYNIIRFDDDWSGVKQDSVAITFDDGYADNFVYAYPLLKKYNIPATFFVSTGTLDTKNEYWWDEITRLCISEKNYGKEFELEDELFNYKWSVTDRESAIDMALSLRHLLRREPDIGCWMDWHEQLIQWSGLGKDGREENYSMSCAQIKEASDSGIITIGAHTVNHFSLGAQYKEQQMFECEESISRLRQITGDKINTFSYPFGGRADYNKDTFDILKKCGIEKASTTCAGVYGNDFHYEIPRVTIKDIDADKFARVLSEYMGR